MFTKITNYSITENISIKLSEYVCWNNKYYLQDKRKLHDGNISGNFPKSKKVVSGYVNIPI